MQKVIDLIIGRELSWNIFTYSVPRIVHAVVVVDIQLNGFVKSLEKKIFSCHTRASIIICNNNRTCRDFFFFATCD